MTTDPQELIDQCLCCDKPHCTNCLGRALTSTKVTTVVMSDGVSIERFASVKEASLASGLSMTSIYKAIREKCKIKGYYWRYE